MSGDCPSIRTRRPEFRVQEFGELPIRGIGPVKRRSRNPSVGWRRELTLICYAGVVDNRAHSIASSRSDYTASPSFEELAAQQGVTPIDDFETLLGEPLPEDESVEEFSASLRDWRREGTRPSSPQ